MLSDPPLESCIHLRANATHVAFKIQPRLLGKNNLNSSGPSGVSLHINHADHFSPTNFVEVNNSDQKPFF